MFGRKLDAVENKRKVREKELEKIKAAQESQEKGSNWSIVLVMGVSVALALAFYFLG